MGRDVWQEVWIVARIFFGVAVLSMLGVGVAVALVSF